MHIPKWLIATAGLLFVVLIAAIAFLIGRESSRPPAEISMTAVPEEAPAAKDSPTEEPASPPAEAGSASASVVTPAVGDPAPSQTTTASSAGASIAAAASSPETAEARVRVATYFTQMEAIQSGGTIGDQEEFATTLIGAAVSGDFSGIDNLVRAASDAERRAAGIQPPVECADYHRLAITLLQESRTLVATLRDGLKRNDANALASVGATAQSMKSRADNLAAAEKALRARFGL